MEADRLISRLDFAILKPEASRSELGSAVEAMKRDRYNSLTVSPWMVAPAVTALTDDGLPVGAVAGFPLGTSTTETKCFEALEAVRAGARMVDVVLPIGRLKGGESSAVAEELARIRHEVDHESGELLIELRGILETGLLDEAELRFAVEALLVAGWDFVKTSTGFGPTGAGLKEVTLLAELVEGRARVKASGGIRTAADALAMFAAGADVVGTGSAPSMAEGFREMESRGELSD